MAEAFAVVYHAIRNSRKIDGEGRDLPVFSFCHPPSVLQWQRAFAFPEQLRKVTGGCISDGFCHFANRQIGVSQQMLRLIDPNLLNVIGDGAVKVCFEGALELSGAHTGNFRQHFNRKLVRIVVTDVGGKTLQDLTVCLCNRRAFSFVQRSMPFKDEGQGFRCFCVIV